jgi:hypothetical protein
MAQRILAREQIGMRKTAFFKGFGLPYKTHAHAAQGTTMAVSPHTARFNQQTEELIFEAMMEHETRGKRRWGFRRALFTYGMFSMFYAFFKELGLNVVMSSPTDENTIDWARNMRWMKPATREINQWPVAELVRQEWIIFSSRIYTR